MVELRAKDLANPGPFEREHDVIEVIGLRDWTLPYPVANQLALYEACALAGVELGAYDKKILDWLTSAAEPQAVAVIIGIILRASATPPPA